jgi:hypothetical protein
VFAVARGRWGRKRVEATDPAAGDIAVITGNLSGHSSCATRDGLAGHPWIQHAFISVGACWLNPLGRCLLAQPARALVADLPPDRRPAQHSDQGPGCGDTRTQGLDATAADLATRYEERSALAFLDDLVCALTGKLEER